MPLLLNCEYLHVGIAAVEHVDAPVRADGDTAGCGELPGLIAGTAEIGDGPARQVEHVHALPVGIGHVDIAAIGADRQAASAIVGAHGHLVACPLTVGLHLYDAVL